MQRGPLACPLHSAHPVQPLLGIRQLDCQRPQALCGCLGGAAAVGSRAPHPSHRRSE